MHASLETYSELNNILNAYTITPLLEFSAIVFVVLVTYLAIHNMRTSWHNLIKFTIALLFGTMGYVVGKFALIVFLVAPLLTLGL